MADSGDPVQQQPALGELLARPGEGVDRPGDIGQRGRPAAALAQPAVLDDGRRHPEAGQVAAERLGQFHPVRGPPVPAVDDDGHRQVRRRSAGTAGRSGWGAGRTGTGAFDHHAHRPVSTPSAPSATAPAVDVRSTCGSQPHRDGTGRAEHRQLLLGQAAFGPDNQYHVPGLPGNRRRAAARSPHRAAPAQRRPGRPLGDRPRSLPRRRPAGRRRRRDCFAASRAAARHCSTAVRCPVRRPARDAPLRRPRHQGVDAGLGGQFDSQFAAIALRVAPAPG